MTVVSDRTKHAAVVAIIWLAIAAVGLHVAEQADALPDGLAEEQDELTSGQTGFVPAWTALIVLPVAVLVAGTTLTVRRVRDRLKGDPT